MLSQGMSHGSCRQCKINALGFPLWDIALHYTSVRFSTHNTFSPKYQSMTPLIIGQKESPLLRPLSRALNMSSKKSVFHVNMAICCFGANFGKSQPPCRTPVHLPLCVSTVTPCDKWCINVFMLFCKTVKPNRIVV